MRFTEYQGSRILQQCGIKVPRAALVTSPSHIPQAMQELGIERCVIKAQVPAGKRGKAGGIKFAHDIETAMAVTTALLAMSIAGYPVKSVLVTEQIAIARELYAAIITDYKSRSPLLLLSSQGGMEVEEISSGNGQAMQQLVIDIRQGLSAAAITPIIAKSGLENYQDQLLPILLAMYRGYRENDSELLEINPLIINQSNELIALDCKFVLDDSSVPRQAELAESGDTEPRTELEQTAAQQGLNFIELDGNIGIIANGAGLTMTTMDMVAHYGGRPANFMEIGGEAYTKAKAALAIVLANPRITSLVVNFCGAFARTDVMTEGLVNAWLELGSKLPIFFTIHGTGEATAIAYVKEKLAITPYEITDDAIIAAVQAGGGQ